jgi:hypothetical protein
MELHIGIDEKTILLFQIPTKLFEKFDGNEHIKTQMGIERRILHQPGNLEIISSCNGDRFSDRILCPEIFLGLRFCKDCS